MLASVNRRSENIIVEPIVIFELTFRDIEWEILAADLVIAADDAALEDTPKTFNRIRVDRANYVLPSGVPHPAMLIFIEPIVNAAFVGCQQTNFVGNDFAHKSIRIFFADGPKDAGYDIALALHRANDLGLSARSVFTALTALTDVFVAVFAANPRLVDFDNAAELIHVLFDERGADAMTHIPSRLERTEAHIAPELAGAHSLFASEHQVSDLVPIPQGLVRVFKDCASDMGEPIAIRGALFALPVAAGSQGIDLGIATTGANHTIRPPTGDQIGDAMGFVREGSIKLGAGHLVDGFGLTGHGGSPSLIEGYSHSSSRLSSPGTSPI